MSPSPSDQNECYSLRCDVNAQCLLNAGSPSCLCVEGFTGDGHLCVGEYFWSCTVNVERMKQHILQKAYRITFDTETLLSHLL